MNEIVTINARTYDGQVRKSWTAELIERRSDFFIFLGVFDRQIVHDHLGVIRPGTISYEFYWLDRWYNVFRFHEPDGSFRNYYCNASMPPTFQNSSLDYTDLDIDIVIDANGELTVLDEDEYRANAERFAYPAAVHSNIAAAVAEVKGLAERCESPFDHRFDGT